MRRVGAVVVLLLGVLALASPAYADPPSAQGWWNLANQGLQQPPDPPDVPSDGLLLQGGLNGPSAYAALSFTLPEGVTAAMLTLEVASTATQATAVQACIAKPGWKPAQGGPMADAPAYDCARSVSAVLSADSKQLVFRDVSGLATLAGALSLALVPGDSDRIALAKPSASALAVQQTTAAQAPPPPVAPPVADGGITAVAPLAPVAVGGPVVPVAAVPGQGAPPAVAPVPQAPAVQTQSTAAKASGSRDTSTGVRLVLAAEALLTLITFGLLGVGPARGLVRLTGAAAVPAGRPRGIGRFSRERVGSAPSL
jgi:hypothetical protein